MCGSELIVTPVLRKDTSKLEVYLPKGDWVQLFTQDEYQGGHISIDTPLGLPLAFYKKGCKNEELFKSIKLK